MLCFNFVLFVKGFWFCIRVCVLSDILIEGKLRWGREEEIKVKMYMLEG